MPTFLTRIQDIGELSSLGNPTNQQAYVRNSAGTAWVLAQVARLDTAQTFTAAQTISTTALDGLTITMDSVSFPNTIIARKFGTNHVGFVPGGAYRLSLKSLGGPGGTGQMRIMTHVAIAPSNYGTGVGVDPSQLLELFSGNLLFSNDSSTTTKREQALIVPSWVDSTDATRKARVIFNVYDTAAREAIRLDTDGTQALTTIQNLTLAGSGTSNVARKDTANTFTQNQEIVGSLFVNNGNTGVVNVRSTSLGFGAPTASEVGFFATTLSVRVGSPTGNVRAMIGEQSTFGGLGSAPSDCLFTLDARTASNSILRIQGEQTQTTAFLEMFRQSSTAVDRAQFEILTPWVDSTDATRKARVIFNVYDTAAREAFRIEASGSASMLGFFGATAVVRPSSTGETTGFTAGGGANVTDASTFTGNVGSTAYRISDIVKHLKNLGLIAA